MDCKNYSTTAVQNFLARTLHCLQFEIFRLVQNVAKCTRHVKIKSIVKTHCPHHQKKFNENRLQNDCVYMKDSMIQNCLVFADFAMMLLLQEFVNFQQRMKIEIIISLIRVNIEDNNLIRSHRRASLA